MQVLGNKRWSIVCERTFNLVGQAMMEGETLNMWETTDYHWNERRNRTEAENEAEIVRATSNHGSEFQVGYTYIWVD